MDICNALKFDQMPDFQLLKTMIRTAADEAGLDIFDNAFDWNLILTSEPSVEIAIPVDPSEMSEERLKTASDLRFNNFDEVKRVIYRAYAKNRLK